jgi:hypothetical protein
MIDYFLQLFVVLANYKLLALVTESREDLGHTVLQFAAGPLTVRYMVLV